MSTARGWPSTLTLSLPRVVDRVKRVEERQENNVTAFN
jgi:Cys-tRNA synthase (O-phospho-L-seryl-tRNA:Cys-tRNA synthase)